jgi:hypothetical protein
MEPQVEQALTHLKEYGWKEFTLKSLELFIGEKILTGSLPLYIRISHNSLSKIEAEIAAIYQISDIRKEEIVRELKYIKYTIPFLANVVFITDHSYIIEGQSYGGIDLIKGFVSTN